MSSSKGKSDGSTQVPRPFPLEKERIEGTIGTPCPRTRKSKRGREIRNYDHDHERCTLRGTVPKSTPLGIDVYLPVSGTCSGWRGRRTVIINEDIPRSSLVMSVSGDSHDGSIVYILLFRVNMSDTSTRVYDPYDLLLKWNQGWGVRGVEQGVLPVRRSLHLDICASGWLVHSSPTKEGRDWDERNGRVFPVTRQSRKKGIHRQLTSTWRNNYKREC